MVVVKPVSVSFLNSMHNRRFNRETAEAWTIQQNAVNRNLLFLDQDCFALNPNKATVASYFHFAQKMASSNFNGVTSHRYAPKTPRPHPPLTLADFVVTTTCCQSVNVTIYFIEKYYAGETFAVLNQESRYGKYQTIGRWR